MLSLTYRNLKLYFGSRSNVILSVLGALIAFVLYLLFIKKGMVDQWQSVSDQTQLLDSWLIGGVLSVTAITTTFASLKQFVLDKETSVLDDLVLSDTSYFKIQMSYILASAVIGFLMQVLTYVLMISYFGLTDQYKIEFGNLFVIILLMIMATVVWTAVNLVILQFVKKVNTVALLSTIIGTASGFLVGTYIPVGTLPDFAQTLVKLTPGSYIAALYRQNLMGDLLQNNLRSNVDLMNTIKLHLGVDFKLFGVLLNSWQYLGILLGVLIVAIILIAISSKHSKRQVY